MAEILENKLAMYLYASLDGEIFKLVNGKRIDSFSAAEREIMLRSTKTTARYFIIVFATEASEAVVEQFELSDLRNNNNKLR